MGAVVRTVSGELRGLVADGVASFLGVPYAAAPFGVNRLAPPQPAPAWAGVRDAVTLGAEPPQVAPPTPTGPPSGAGEDWEDVGAAFEAVRRAAPSEDCLNLNLWTPDPGAAGLPVMVWIQGGMFELSSTAAYDGSRFARDGVRLRRHQLAARRRGIPLPRRTASPTSGCSTRSPRSSGCGRTSPPSAATPTTSPSSVSPPAR